MRAFETDRILIMSVIRLIVAVEEHLRFIDAAIQQTVYAAAAGVMILTKLIDKALFVDIIEITRAVFITVAQRCDQLVIIKQRPGSAVVGETDKRIILLLIELDVFIQQEGVDVL